MSEDRPRLYLMTPPLDDAALAPALSEAVAAAEIACLLVRLATKDPGQRKKIVRALADVAQPKGVAVLVEDDPQLAARAGADGVHVNGYGEAFAEALKSMRPDRIVGIGHLATRDDAMDAGEDEADYLFFGEPAADGFVRPLDWRIERVAWWAEIFNTPCVAFAAASDEVTPLAGAGADFVALGDWIWRDPRGAAAIVAEAASDLAALPPREA